MKRRAVVYGGLVALLLTAWTLRANVRLLLLEGRLRPRSVAEVVATYGEKTRAAYESRCREAGVPYPPEEVWLLAFKDEKRLEVWGRGQKGPAFLKAYPFTAFSGTLGPKRREGDLQIPEGFYEVGHLNPNSSYHLSLFVTYPNATDVAHSKVPRKAMGGEIFIHGRAVTIGCIPLGDDAIEEVFTLVAQAREGKRHVVIAPVDFRKRPGFRLEGEEAWVGRLYAELESTLSELSSGS